MRNRIRTATARAGFTLIEVLVTLVLIALLVGVIVPSVINQLGSGEPARVASDLEGVRSSVKLFRIDVRRFPGLVHQLVLHPDDWATVDGSPGARADSADINGNEMEGLVSRWSGPYLETGEMGGTDSDSLIIALNGRVDNALVAQQWDGATGPDWVTAHIYGLTELQAQGISEVVDGNTDTSSGRVRWDTDHIVYFVVPIN